ncbi:MAG: PepSY domain-containing protein [Proteobacteria bacterium]|nr:PepSY domain-containing protein [Pseudomonadota bacterium]
MYHHTRLTLVAITLAASGAVAYAATGSTQNDAVAIHTASVPLVQAVTIAEQYANGKASRAEYEKSGQDSVYDVEIVSGTSVFDVRVDASKGNVISSVEDQADREDDGDEQD